MKVVEVSNVSKKFHEKGKSIDALSDVNFDIKKGEIFSLLGPNGAGKTTIINILTGILVQDAGAVKIFGHDIRDSHEYLSEINSVSGETKFHWVLNASDILEFYGRVYKLPRNERKKRIAELVDLFEMHDIMKRRFDQLSTGERMRLIFAKALINKPRLLLLDEPTLGLDPDISIKVRKEIAHINAKFRTTILLTSHYMHEVEQLADRVAFIYNGKIMDIGTVEHLKKKRFETYKTVVTVKKVKNRALLEKSGFRIRGNRLYKDVPIQNDISEVVEIVTALGMQIADINTGRPTLEDYFVHMTREGVGI